MYSEWMKGEFFPEGSPLDSLIIQKMDEDEYSKKYLGGIKVVYDDENKEQVQFPEEWSDHFQRAKLSV